MGRKLIDMYDLMYRLAHGESLTVNTTLAESLGVSTKTLGRYLDEIHFSFSDIITVEKKKIENHPRQPNVYRVIDQQKDLVAILRTFFEKNEDLGWLLQLLHEKDPEFATNESYRAELQKMLSEDSDIFIFKSMPFELLDHQHKKIFRILKSAIKLNEYKAIVYHYQTKEVIQKAKCLKLIFTQNNWYLAIENEADEFRLLRVSFIEDVQVIKGKSRTFQRARVKKYDTYFQNIQNAMTLHNKPIQKAICRASSKIAIYFQNDMKPFMLSQKYLRTNEDGSVDFELHYTQPLEILPFIKQWLPDIKIVEPNSLAEEIQCDLMQALKEYRS